MEINDVKPDIGVNFINRCTGKGIGMKLPYGISDFRKMSTGNYVYPDKTRRVKTDDGKQVEAVQIARKKGMLSTYPKLWSNYFRK